MIVVSDEGEIPEPEAKRLLILNYKKAFDSFLGELGTLEDFYTSVLATNISTKNVLNQRLIEYRENEKVRKAIKNVSKIPQQHIDLLREMFIIYLVVIFEDFLKKILEIRCNELNMDESEKKKLFKDFSYKDFKYKWEKIAGLFGIDMGQFKNNTLKELFERRNILVHNKGVVDKKYIKKVKNSEYKEGNKILVDPEYVKSSIESVIDFVKTFQDEVQK